MWRICLSTAWIVSCSVYVASADEQMLARLRDGYAANREKLSAFSCEFTFTEADASSVDEARAGTLERPISSTGIWMVDGNKVRYERTSTPLTAEEEAAFRKALVGQGGGFVGTRFGSEAILFDGTIRLNYSDGLQTANIAQHPGADIVLTPSSMGAMGSDENRSPSVGIENGLKGIWSAEYLGTRESYGRQTHVVDIGRDPNDKTAVDERWFLDAERGFLPIEGWYYDELVPWGIGYKVYITDVLEVSPGVFVPKRTVMVRFPDGRAPFEVRMFEVIKFVLATPDEGDMYLDLPAKTRILDPSGDMRAGFRVREQTRVNVDDLPSILDECHLALERVLAGQPPKE